MKQAAAPDLDPSKFTVVPHVAVIDEFKMTNDDGSFVADINERFLDRLIARMREREQTTGDLCPGVIGHTKDGEREIEGPPVTAYLRNWVKDDFFETGRKAAFADIWVFNEDVDTVRKFPRRSAEVWPDRFEIDPISFLGATTPARDLGLLRLSRGGSFTYTMPGETKMPEPKIEPNPDETGAAKGSDAKLDQIIAALTKLTDLLGSGGKTAEPAPGASGPGGDMSDDEFMKLLEGSGGAGGEKPPEAASRKEAEKPVQNAAQPGGDNTYISDLAKTKAKLSRMEITNYLKAARFEKNLDVTVDDEGFVADLISMPDDLRDRTLERHVKNARPLPTGTSTNLTSALANGIDGSKKEPTQEDVKRIIKLARDKQITYVDAKAELGFGR